MIRHRDSIVKATTAVSIRAGGKAGASLRRRAPPASRSQLSPNLSLMPDLQLFVDPANKPAESQVWALGFRAIVTF